MLLDTPPFFFYYDTLKLPFACLLLFKSPTLNWRKWFFSLYDSDFESQVTCWLYLHSLLHVQFIHFISLALKDPCGIILTTPCTTLKQKNLYCHHHYHYYFDCTVKYSQF